MCEEFIEKLFCGIKLFNVVFPINSDCQSAETNQRGRYTSIEYRHYSWTNDAVTGFHGTGNFFI